MGIFLNFFSTQCIRNWRSSLIRDICKEVGTSFLFFPSPCLLLVSWPTSRKLPVLRCRYANVYHRNKYFMRCCTGSLATSKKHRSKDNVLKTAISLNYICSFFQGMLPYVTLESSSRPTPHVTPERSALFCYLLYKVKDYIFWMASEDKSSHQFSQKEVIFSLVCVLCFWEELFLKNSSLRFPTAMHRIYHLFPWISVTIFMQPACVTLPHPYTRTWVQCIPHPLQPARERQACTFRPLSVSPLRGRGGCHSHVPPPCAACQLHGDIWPAFSTSYETKLKSSPSQRALRCCSLRLRDVSQSRDQYFFCGARPVGRYSSPSGGDCQFTAALIDRVWP